MHVVSEGSVHVQAFSAMGLPSANTSSRIMTATVRAHKAATGDAVVSWCSACSSPCDCCCACDAALMRAAPSQLRALHDCCCGWDSQLRACADAAVPSIKADSASEAS